MTFYVAAILALGAVVVLPLAAGGWLMRILDAKEH